MKKFVKKFLPRSLFGRSLLILIVPVLLIQVISSIVFFNRHWEEMTDRLAFAVAGEIVFILEQVETSNLDQTEFIKLAERSARTLDIIISYEDGATLGGQENIHSSSVVAKTLERAMAGQVTRPFAVSVNIRQKQVSTVIELEEGLLHIILPQKRLFSSSGYVFLLWMIGASLMLLAVAVLFMRNQVRPIRRLAIAAERFGKGRDIPASFKPEGAREVRQAAQAFLEMYDRIKRQIQQRTALLAGVSHDLRTPLTRMKLQAAMLPGSPDIEALKSDISDMEKMIDAYLDFARGEGTEPTSRVSLNEIVDRVAANARRQNTQVTVDFPQSDIVTSLRPVAFERCLANVVNNACKYATSIWIKVEASPDEISILIDDNGPGITEEQFEEVFKPFVRGEPSRNQATGGVGLGLPIARDIITGHGGRIWLEKSGHGGLLVNIHLPR